MKFFNQVKKFGNALKSKAGKVTTMMTTAAISVFAFASAAGAAPATGHSGIDSALTELESGFGVADKAFVYLMIAAVPVTILVVIFFWLRGKFKQTVSGA